MKPVRDIVSSKQTTETEGRRVLNQNFCGCLPLLHITYRSEVAVGGKHRLTSANLPVLSYTINKPQHQRWTRLIVVELLSCSTR
jgi:hypothetical protein